MQRMQISTDHEAQNHQSLSRSPIPPASVLSVLGAVTLAVTVSWSSLRSHESHNLPVTFTCPPAAYFNSSSSNKFNEDIMIEDYYSEKEAKLMNKKDIQTFLRGFHNQTFDAWGRTYDQVKKNLEQVKLEWYAPELRKHNGVHTIYESAAGTGLNLYLTIELIQEHTDLSNVYVYGNDYLPKSVERANNLFEYAPPRAGKRGVICPGDSENLFFVPSNAFDIVYTGYLSPAWDPLNLGKGMDQNYEIMASWCSDVAANKTSKTIEHSKTLVRLMQEAQEKHYADWVAEMVRIAKPGAPVIVETASYPYCENLDDWGGVNEKFWTERIVDSFKLTIEKGSIKIVKAHGLDVKRYHVFMRKQDALV